MVNSLRFRLILSHVLPLLIIIPLMGIALTYPHAGAKPPATVGEPGT